LSDHRVQEKQNALEYICLDPERLRRDDQRLPGIIARDPFGKRVAHAHRTLQNADELALVALERGDFEPPRQFAGDRRAAADRRVRSDIEIDENKPAFFGCGGKEQLDQAVSPGLSAAAGPGRRTACEPVKDGSRRGWLGRQQGRHRGAR
jgi:hypothetical protein